MVDLFKASPHKEEMIEALRLGTSKAEIAKHYGVHISTVKRYAQELNKGKGKEKKAKEPKEPEQQQQQLVTVGAKRPAPVIFFLGEQQIELEPEAIYESYLLYQDMKVRAGLSDGFSNVIRDGVALLWRVIASEPIIEKGEVKMGVNYGRSFGKGEAEPPANEQAS